MFKKLMAVLFMSIALPTLSACTSMADATSKIAGLGVVSQETSTFDGSTIVEVSPTWLYDPDGSYGNRVKLGARWSSNAPNYVALILSYGSNTYGSSAVYMNLTGIDINMDGDIKSFSSEKPTRLDSSGYNTVTKTIYTESKNSVVMPYQTLERLVAAKDSRLRIHTSSGYEDARFSIERIPGGQGTAILSIREFIDKVRSVKTENH